jgi:pyruvate dehydrogenase E1 component alpha subunit/2-oxoisovalerate dehydrogenase E1 component alpha subunit
MGDGATSEGDFHYALNFAGVYKAPCVFFCQNNHWSISVPTAAQTRARTIAEKAQAYGLPVARVDGNDILAMISATRIAAARARAGEGPTLIEALTYRRAAHSSSDDPSVYRKGKDDEIKEWERRDPVARFARYLERRGILTPAIDAQYRDEITQEISAALAHIEHVGTPPLMSLIEDVYAQPTAPLREQLAELLTLPRQKLGHG